MTTDIVLIESKAAREDHLHQMRQDQAQGILDQVKGLVFAMWKGEGIATTAQMAEFYQVSEEVVRDNVRRHKDEFESDGLRVLKGKALSELREIVSLSPNSPNETAWTPRAAIRLGMLLRDSQVAKQVRTTLLDLVQHGIPAQSERIQELELALALERERNLGKQLDNTMLQLHGKETVLTLRGHADQVIQSEPIVVVEVVEQATGSSRRIVSADELKRAVKRKTGQKLNTATWFAQQLRKAGRDDLLVPVKRQAIGEYITPESLDEAIRVVYGSQRQALLGE